MKGLTRVGCKIIVDDILAFAAVLEDLVKYWEVVLEVLQEHSATLKLKKTSFLPQKPEYVGVQLNADGNSPAESKFTAFRLIPPPETWSDLSMLIGMFGFYAMWICLYEVRIQQWRVLQGKRPKPGDVTVEEERDLMKAEWTPKDDVLLAELKNDVLSGPVLMRPDPEGLFVLKTDWSNVACGAVLCQADPDNPETPILVEAVRRGEKCPYDLSKSGPRLRPIAFYSRKATGPERSYHSFIGEAGCGRWAMAKSRKLIIGRPFIWLTDCSGLKRFFETADDVPTHMIQRWRAELLMFDFRLEHRPAALMKECDMLSRYNKHTAEWRDADPTAPANVVVPYVTPIFEPEFLEEDRAPIMHILSRPEFRGKLTWEPSSNLSRTTDPFPVHPTRSLCSSPVDPSTPVHRNEPRGRYAYCRATRQMSQSPQVNGSTPLSRSLHSPPIMHWYVAVYPKLASSTPSASRTMRLREWLTKCLNQAKQLIKWASTQAIVLVFPLHAPDPAAIVRTFFRGDPDWNGWTVESHTTMQLPTWRLHRDRAPSCYHYTQRRNARSQILRDNRHRPATVAHPRH